jgi:hypothetical protein
MCAHQEKNATPQHGVDDFDVLQLLGSVISIVVYGAIVVAATDPGQWGPYLLSIASVWLLFSGCFEAFWLLEAETHEARTGRLPKFLRRLRLPNPQDIEAEKKLS